MYGKSNMETYITICKIDSQWEFAVWLRKLKQGLCINLEAWDGEEVGRDFQKGGDIWIHIADSLCCTVDTNTKERLHFHFSLSCIGEGNGNSLQCSCLDNPRDRGAWWAAVYGVAQSRTRLK